MRVFLGGTVNGSRWRERVKEELVIDYFDPVVDDWNDAAYERELAERRFCNYLLYVITPKMTGFYAIAEVTDDSYHRPDRTVFCYLPEDDGDTFDEHQIAEFEKIGRTVEENGARWLKNLDEVILFLNSSKSLVKYEESGQFDAYISYGRQESRDFAFRILNRLSEKNHTVYMDMEDIPLMIENEEFIYSSILRSDNFIYVISPNSVRSEYCRKELNFAIRYNKRIIPVLHHELGQDGAELDDIVAKKRIIKVGDPIENLQQVVDAIEAIILTDQPYVRMHSQYLFKARKWEFRGRRQGDLLYGKERKKAVEWLSQSSTALIPLQAHRDYIEASKSISVFMLPLLWLNKRTRWFTHLKWFDKAAMLISLVSPIAMMDQIRSLVMTQDHQKAVEAVSLPMWGLFLGIQVTLLMVGVKQKDLRLFLSMILSALVSATVIAIVLFYIFEN